jgi:hypothetical protein
VSVGRPAAEDGHATGAVIVGFNVALIGYVSFEVAFSLNIAVELPVVVFSAERADGGRRVGEGSATGLNIHCHVVSMYAIGMG